jgi:hypothetical protein
MKKYLITACVVCAVAAIAVLTWAQTTTRATTGTTGTAVQKFGTGTATPTFGTTGTEKKGFPGYAGAATTGDRTNFTGTKWGWAMIEGGFGDKGTPFSSYAGRKAFPGEMRPFTGDAYLFFSRYEGSFFAMGDYFGLWGYAGSLDGKNFGKTFVVVPKEDFFRMMAEWKDFTGDFWALKMYGDRRWEAMTGDAAFTEYFKAYANGDMGVVEKWKGSGWATAAWTTSKYFGDALYVTTFVTGGTY